MRLKYGLLATSSFGVLAAVYGSVTGHETFYKSVLMPVVQQFDPESAHNLGVKLASLGMVPRDNSPREKTLVSLISVELFAIY